MVAGVLRDTGLPPATLELEITESVLMDDASRAVRVLGALKSLGVQLSVDDFGTGYSSLSYLKRFPVDAVKIDRSFVDGLGRDIADSAIVDAIISMADALELATIAEGIETPLQLRELVDLGCTYAQGYLFSRPVPAAELETSLHLGTLTPRSSDPEPELAAGVRRLRSAPRRLGAELDTVLAATRELLWIETAADAARIADELVAALGGPAEPGSPAEAAITRHLPAFLADAERTIRALGLVR
jgi:predicted signal transduction protein with EAL and GGDEF domain